MDLFRKTNDNDCKRLKIKPVKLLRPTGNEKKSIKKDKSHKLAGPRNAEEI